MQNLQNRIKEIEQMFESPSFLSDCSPREFSKLLNEYDSLCALVLNKTTNKKYDAKSSTHLDGYRFAG